MDHEVEELPWYVFTPGYEVRSIWDFGPSEEVVDVVEVTAPTKSQALRRARKLLDEQYPRGYTHERRGEGLFPYTGLKAELARCPHGVDEPHGCPTCDEEQHLEEARMCPVR